MNASLASIAAEQVTGLVLAGGRGSRMGGVDKGLQPFQGQPLAQRALQRLQPQAGPCLLNANRHLDVYRAMGVPVCSDADALHAAAGVPGGDGRTAYPGPLAGFLAGLACCQTPWLVTVPCDSPNFPLDLVARLAHGLVREQADLAMATTRVAGVVQWQPVFCLLSKDLRGSLQHSLQAGQRKVENWARQHRCALVAFEDSAAFANANTLADLQQLQAR